jgi:glucosamine-6-phosphate deaminase
MFAAAPSQTETLEALIAEPGIDWPQVQAFHLDEYSGATADSSHSFRRYLKNTLFSRVPIGHFEGLRAEADDLEAECIRYAEALFRANPIVALLGIGENGHLAFNDPPAARFDDPASVRVVQLTESCRVQQVHDKTFPDFESVPLTALSVTIPRLMQVPHLFVMVPGVRKAEAVRAALEGPITEDCPASILREHPNATLFLDRDSASLLRAA